MYVSRLGEAKVAGRVYGVLFVHFRHRYNKQGLEIRLRCVYDEITRRRRQRTDAHWHDKTNRNSISSLFCIVL